MTVVPVDELDFLPADFHARRRQRRARQWRWAVAGMFVALIALGVIGNRIQHRRLAADVDRLRPRAAAVGELERRLAEADAQVVVMGLRADLRGQLRLRPATTRLLAAVTVPLPATASLMELRLAVERPDDPAAMAATTTPSPEEAAQPPERRDLDRLAAASPRRQTITVEGLAPDDATISDYLTGLRGVGVFDEVQLLFIDGYDHRGHTLRSFSIRMRVREALPTSPGLADAPDAASGANGGAA